MKGLLVDMIQLTIMYINYNDVTQLSMTSSGPINFNFDVIKKLFLTTYGVPKKMGNMFIKNQNTLLCSFLANQLAMSG